MIDSASRDWLIDAFAWALRNADAKVFYQQTQLILPTPEFFPDRSQSAGEMASQVLSRVVSYAHMNNWPLALVHPDQFHQSSPIEPLLEGDIRSESNTQLQAQSLPTMPLTCISPQLNNPEALIGSFAQGASYYLSSQIKELPPGGQNYLPQAVDVLAIFLGFGIMLANSAYTFKGSCGSCYNPLANRQAALTELDTVYALAIFCSLKEIPATTVKPHLKKHLRSTFARASKEIKQQNFAKSLQQYYPVDVSQT